MIFSASVKYEVFIFSFRIKIKIVNLNVLCSWICNYYYTNLIWKTNYKYYIIKHKLLNSYIRVYENIFRL